MQTNEMTLLRKNLDFPGRKRSNSWRNSLPFWHPGGEGVGFWKARCPIDGSIPFRARPKGLFARGFGEGVVCGLAGSSDLPFTGGETKKRASLLGQYVAFLNWPLWVKAQFVPGKGACDLTGEKTAGWLRSLRAPYGEKENNNQRWSHYHPETKIGPCPKIGTRPLDLRHRFCCPRYCPRQ